MVDMDAEKKYFSEALCLFHEMQWLHNVPVTEILTRGSLDAIPEEWMEQLEILSNKELNDFVLGETMKVSKNQLYTYIVINQTKYYLIKLSYSRLNGQIH